MRKITLLFSIVCAFVLCATVSAQTLVPALQDKGVKSVSATPATALETGKWYVMERGSDYAYDAGTRMLHAGKNTLVAVGFTTEDCGKALFQVMNIEDAMIGEVPVKKFTMQWGTGHYASWKNGYDKAIATVDATGTSTDIYAASTVTDNGTWFRFAQNTSTTFGNGNNLMFDAAASGIVCAWADATHGYDELNSDVTSNNRAWKVYEVELVDLVDAKIVVKNGTDGEVKRELNLQLPVGATITLKNYLPANGLITYPNTTATVVAGSNEFQLEYTEEDIPYAESYEKLEEGNKWVSMFTLNGRMHVYDDTSEGNIYSYDSEGNATITGSRKKYPTIDKATFTRLNDNHFWGFICDNPFYTEAVKIVNKAAGPRKYLHLTNNGNDMPLLFTDADGNVLDTWKTDEWVFEKSTNPEIPANEAGLYYGIKANGYGFYINNFNNNGYMTTYGGNATADKGSNIKFVKEIDTYNILKERALAAPCGAVHSLNQAARDEINNIPADQCTVAKYKEVINDINEGNPETGYIDFDERRYYILRNYTPESGTIYALGSENGTTPRTFTVSADDAGSNSEVMKTSNVNAIWQITANDNVGEAPGTGIGASRTIARKVTHVNSGNSLTAANTRTLTADGDNYYFVDLGAGQHFMKNIQYNGSGQQARNVPLSCNDTGDLYQKQAHIPHKKNSRDTWYGIEVSSLNISLNPGNDGKYYATAHFPFAISIPENAEMTAYTVESISSESGHMTLEAVAAGETIPANTGLILIGDKQASTVDIVSKARETAQADPILKGVNMAETFGSTIAKADVLVLGQDANGNVGFYRPSDAMTGLRSNSAYILVSALNGGNPVNGLKFNFGGIANGIDGVSTDSNNGQVIYDLQGRRVNKLSKGLYIVNGKKVIR
ncbi:MAG: hypothetical protein IJY00_01075 [Bacteroidaceae bacterium]|nr:hypothetical protein [Bacteroidaceae bacterium]